MTATIELQKLAQTALTELSLEEYDGVSDGTHP